MDRRSALIDVGIGLLVAVVILLLASGPAAAGLIGLLVVLLLVAGRFLPGLWARHHPTAPGAARRTRAAAPRRSGSSTPVRPTRRQTPAESQMTAAERYAARQAARERQQVNRRGGSPRA